MLRILNNSIQVVRMYMSNSFLTLSIRAQDLILKRKKFQCVFPYFQGRYQWGRKNYKGGDSRGENCFRCHLKLKKKKKSVLVVKGLRNVIHWYTCSFVQFTGIKHVKYLIYIYIYRKLFRFWLRFAYFVEIENLLLKVL